MAGDEAPDRSLGPRPPPRRTRRRGQQRGTGLPDRSVGGRGFYSGPQLSPDGSRLAVTELRENNIDVYVYELDGSGVTCPTFDPARDDDAVYGAPRLLFEGRLNAYVAGEGYSSFDVDSNGERFLVVESPAKLWGDDHVRLVTGFHDRLSRLD